MTDQPNSQPAIASTVDKNKKKVSAEKVAERVFQLLLAEARIERERRG